MTAIKRNRIYVILGQLAQSTPGDCTLHPLEDGYCRGLRKCRVRHYEDRGLPIGPKEQTAPTLVKAARATRHA
ncbi:hypothetical protein, partial [Mesorhizobium sp.]|uniref:hypothetical protein n=1 Tax=Mesorhizobium sp. TaxID=1871066 RepID=UPI00258046B0